MISQYTTDTRVIFIGLVMHYATLFNSVVYSSPQKANFFIDQTRCKWCDVQTDETMYCGEQCRLKFKNHLAALRFKQRIDGRRKEADN
jgi:hypothetical protein